MKSKPGNGSSKFPIHVQDLGGWIRVFTDRAATVPEDFHVYLSQAMTDWFRKRPNLRMRCVLPIPRNGEIIELHAWFDVHVFPAPQPPKKGDAE